MKIGDDTCIRQGSNSKGNKHVQRSNRLVEGFPHRGVQTEPTQGERTTEELCIVIRLDSVVAPSKSWGWGTGNHLIEKDASNTAATY